MANRRKRKQRALYESLKTELTKGVPLDRCKIVIEPGGQEKMSEVLMEFLEPYSRYWETKEELTKLLAVAAIAWNASFFPREEWAEIIENGESIPPEMRQDLKGIIEAMIERKERYFGNIKRMIMNYNVTMTKEGRPYVTVLSTRL